MADIAVVFHGLQGGAPALLLDHAHLQGLRFVVVEQQFVYAQGVDIGAGHFVKHAAGFLPRIQMGAVVCPKIGRQLAVAAIEDIAVFQHFIVGVVFGVQPERACFDADIDVFRHQGHIIVIADFVGKRLHYGENLVVALASGQALGQRCGFDVGLQHELALRFAAAGAGERNAAAQKMRAGIDHFVEKAAGLAGIARHIGHAFFVRIHFFERDDGDIKIMLFEFKQAGRVVQQHIGVENKQLAA